MFISIGGIDGCGAPAPRGSKQRTVALLATLLLLTACPGGANDGDPGSVIDDQGNVAQWAIGVPDPEATMVVMELAGLGPDHTLAVTPTAELVEARRAVLALEVGAVPSIAQQVRNTGCRQPQGAELFGLLAALAKGRGFEASRAIAVADLALGAATGPLTPTATDVAGFDALVSGLADDPSAAIAARAEALEQAVGSARSARGQQLCVGRALDLARSLHRIDKIGDGNLQPLVEKHLATLPDGDARAIDLVGMIDAAAPEDRAQAEKLQGLTLDERLHPEARALACSAAIERRSRMERATAAMKTLPGPVVRCLLLQGRGNEWWDTALAREVLLHGDLEVRLAAIDLLRHQADGPDFELLRLRLEDPHPADPAPGLRERGAVVRAAAEILQMRPEIRAPSLEAVRGQALRAELEQRLETSEDQRPSDERLAEATCDVRVEPDEGASGLAEGARSAGPGGTVCAVEGRYAGTLELGVAGARLVSLTPGRTVVGGHLVIRQPATVVGLQVDGSLLVGPTAGGSVLVGLRSSAASLVEPVDALLVDVASEAGITGPWPDYDGALHVPAGATSLLIRPGDRVEEVGIKGGASGWIDLEMSSWLTGVELWQAEPPIQATPAARSPGMWAALTGGGLPLPAPDRYQTPPLGRWASVWGTEPGGAALAVPLRTAPWWPGAADLVVGLE